MPDSADLSVTPLQTQRLCLAVPATHPLGRAPRVGLQAAAAEVFIGFKHLVEDGVMAARVVEDEHREDHDGREDQPQTEQRLVDQRLKEGLSAEYYFPSQGMISFGVFRKKITDYIETDSSQLVPRNPR